MRGLSIPEAIGTNRFVNQHFSYIRKKLHFRVHLFEDR